MYKDWKVKKSVIHYEGDDLKKQQESQAAQAQYLIVVDWLKDNKEYTMGQDKTYYKVVSVVKPTHDDISSRRENAYKLEVDGITSHIQRLRDTNPMTEEVEIEIANLIVERDKKVEDIKKRYPYEDENEDI